MSLLEVNVNGTIGSVIQCAYCQHTNPPQCPMCKPLGTENCIGCLYRGDGVPSVTTTIAPGQVNDDPSTETGRPNEGPFDGGTVPMTIVSTPSGMNEPPGHNA